MNTLKNVHGYRRGGRNAGFTLVEVVIALAILAFGLFGTISVIAYTSRMNVTAHEQALAMRAAEKKIEQMMSCSSFDDIVKQYSQQVEGLGWEQVSELDLNGVAHYLKPLTLTTGQRTIAIPNGFQYPVPDPKAVLFVRFPLDSASVASVGPPVTINPLYIVEANVGPFLDAKDNSLNPIAGLDLNSNGNTNDKFYYNSNTGTLPPAGYLAMSTIKLIPVWIEVHWSGLAGPSHLVYKYTFMRGRAGQ
ncbi:MAG TPA: prepilin-type N-terminal cleavage/methylation domain-containing protein [Planctomycetota bacterium]|nr:prepilin-type N-terminal cleavage/methylation domain-containing protein [Planctomycetota bacterium]